MPTIYDVAQLAAVSPSTVSRVINGRGNVDAELAKRVRQAVLTLNYRPNSVARNLRRQTSAVWRVIIPDIENPHFTSLIRGIEDVAQAVGNSVVLCNTDEDIAKEQRYVDVAVTERAAGVIMSPAADSQSTIGPLLERGVPVVTIDRRLRKSPVDAVMVENSEGAAAATAHLLESGYSRVACITGPMRTSTAAQRLYGYRRAVRAAGFTYDRRLVRVADYKEVGGYEAARMLLDAAEPPDALFVANSLMTIGAVRCIGDVGLEIPREIGIVGFDDHRWAELLRPPLSTVAQPTYEQGRAAAHILLERAADPDAPPRTVKLPTQLIVRESSVRCPVVDTSRARA